MNAVEAVVRRYYATVSDLTSTRADLQAVVHPEITVIEHPNRLVANGATYDAESSARGFEAGKALLAEQQFDVLDVLVSGDRAATRTVWTATIGVDRGPFTAGQRLTAWIGGFSIVRDGLIWRHETFDCYEPFPIG